MRFHEFEIYDQEQTKAAAKQEEQEGCWADTWAYPEIQKSFSFSAFPEIEDDSSVSENIKTQKGNKSKERIVLEINLFPR